MSGKVVDTKHKHFIFSSFLVSDLLNELEEAADEEDDEEEDRGPLGRPFMRSTPSRLDASDEENSAMPIFRRTLSSDNLSTYRPLSFSLKPTDVVEGEIITKTTIPRVWSSVGSPKAPFPSVHIFLSFIL